MTLEPNMAISVPGQISGGAVIDDLIRRIVDKLEKSGDLRAVDSYAGYAARVSISLQLVDLNKTEVNADINVGVIDPQQPVRQVALGTDMVAMEANVGSLERMADGSLPEGAETPARRRQYVSRVRG
jgi:hypothetical protein